MPPWFRQCSKLVAFACLVLSSAATTAQNTNTTNQPLGAGDVVRITVFGQPDLTTLTRVGEDGQITFPLLGSVNLTGMSAGTAETHIAGLLEQEGFVRNAQVSIFLEERSQGFADHATILGKVSRPGKYPLQSTSVQGVNSVVDLLATAGGTTSEAADKVLLLRATNDSYERFSIDLTQLIQEGKLEVDVLLENGDVVLVPAADVFYIYGQVERPGQYQLEPDMTVMQALAIASGVTRLGSEKGIVLRRRDENAISESEVSLTLQLQPNDVIYVKERRF